MTDQETIHAAVTRCADAWAKALAAHGKKENKIYDPLDLNHWAVAYAGQAYRNALPYLTSPLQIDAFIACVAHGMAITAIDEKSGAKLLYAAQVAITSRKAQLQAGCPPSPALGDRGGLTAPAPTSPAPDTPTAPQRTTPTPSPSESANSNQISIGASADPTPPPSAKPIPARSAVPPPRPGKKQKAWKRSHWRPMPQNAA